MTQVINENTVNSVLDFNYLVDYMRLAHKREPAQADDMFMYDSKENCLLNRVAWENGKSLGIKLATVFPDNASLDIGVPTTQAAYVLFNGEDGSLQAVIDGKTLTNYKTAADSALGASFLAREDAKVLLMIGAGSMAPYLIESHLSVRPSIEKIFIWNRTVSKTIALKDKLSNRDICVVEDLSKVIGEADVISCATSSSAPVLQGKYLKEGVHVDLVGGYNLKMREADDDVIRRANIFVDSRRTTIGDVGDIQTPIDNGLITEADIKADLYDLCAQRHSGRQTSSEITMFKNGGGGHLDLMTAQAITQRLKTQ